MFAFTLTAKVWLLPLVAALLNAAPVVRAAPRVTPIAPTAVEHVVYGTVAALSGYTLIVRTRTGRLLDVDGRAASISLLLFRNRPVKVFGTVDAGGVLHARGIWRGARDAMHWPADE